MTAGAHGDTAISRTRLNALIDKITMAFADVAYPGDDDLTDSTYGEEPAALVRDFCGRTDWRALDARQVSAVVAYLWWRLESLGGYDPTIEQALENYWLVREAEQQANGG